jgi:alanine racemase
MFPTSCIELSLSALRKNLRFLREHVGHHVRFSSVIKGNAYGHGIEKFVPMAESCGVRHFSVFSADEALRAHRARTDNSELMIMGAIDNEQIEWAIRKDIAFYIFELDRLGCAIDTAKRIKKPARIHLELETGLNRTGLDGDTLEEALAAIKDNASHLRIDGLCTHFAGAESIGNYVRIMRQIHTFIDARDRLKQQGVSANVAHAACSAAVFAYPMATFDMVRVGIAQYGFWPSLETRMHYFLQNAREGSTRVVDPLRRVMRWTSRVMSVKDVKPGEFIGYGTTFLTSRPQRIATVPIGYSHGFSRSLSNLGYVLLHGRRANVIGVVNMNMMMIDVSDFPSVHKGDQVVIIGRQKRMQISVASFSDLTRQIDYEVLVRLPADIPRVVVD